MRMARMERRVQVPMAYRVHEAAQLLGVSPNTLREQIRLGRVPHIRMGRRIIIPHDALETWLIAAATANQAR